MKIVQFVRCLFTGHNWTNSHKKRGLRTCTKCGVRRRY